MVQPSSVVGLGLQALGQGGHHLLDLGSGVTLLPVGRDAVSAAGACCDCGVAEPWR
jgi:hypothetical protein